MADDISGRVVFLRLMRFNSRPCSGRVGVGCFEVHRFMLGEFSVCDEFVESVIDLLLEVFGVVAGIGFYIIHSFGSFLFEFFSFQDDESLEMVESFDEVVGCKKLTFCQKVTGTA